MDSGYMLRTYSAVQDHDPASGGGPTSKAASSSVRRKPVPVAGGSDGYYSALLDADPAPGYQQYAPKTKSRKNSFLRWWTVEILASVLSLASLMSIVLLLRHYDGVGLGDLNLPSSLTLNGIIAAIATLNRVALMVPVGSAMSQEAWLWLYSDPQKQSCHSRLADLETSDAASRGAWGSFLFFFVARRRWLAYLGALITILSLAFGTFTQQLITIANFPVVSPNLDPGLLPGNLPRAETFQYFSGNPAEYGFTIPFSFRAAIYNGMLSDEITPLTAPCPTGNCTWPITPSLAICGECSPSTYQLHCDNTRCNYTMPSGSIIPLTNIKEVGLGLGFAVTPSSGAKYNASLKTTLYIANFDVVGAPYHALAQAFSNASTRAAECAMWVCVQAYNTSTRANVQTQTIVANYSSMNANFTGGSVVYNYTFPSVLPSSMNPTSNTNYSIALSAAAGLADTLIKFNGTASLDISNSQASNDYVDAVWSANFTQLDPWIKKLSLSLTNTLRNQTGQPSHNAYNGIAFQLGVQVRWVWIILPAILVGLSIVFLSLIMLRTAVSPVEAWKGSPLAFLILEVDPHIRGMVRGHTDEVGGVERAVGQVRVKIEPESDGGADGRREGGGKRGGLWKIKAA